MSDIATVSIAADPWRYSFVHRCESLYARILYSFPMKNLLAVNKNITYCELFFLTAPVLFGADFFVVRDNILFNSIFYFAAEGQMI